MPAETEKKESEETMENLQEAAPTEAESPPPEGSLVVISKSEFLKTLEGIRSILGEYGLLIDKMAETEEWGREALEVIRSHHSQCENGSSTLSKIGLVIGLFQYLVSRVNQEQFNFKIPTRIGVIPEEENKSLAEFSEQLKVLKNPIESLVGDIIKLANSEPIRSQEKLYLLLIAIVSFFKALIRQDWEDVTLVMDYINLLTTSSESHHLVKQIAKIARNIYNSLNEFSQYFTVESLTQSTGEIPDAVVKLNSVIEKLEIAANTNLDSLENLSNQNNENLKWLKESEDVVLGWNQKITGLQDENPDLSKELEEVQSEFINEIGKDLILLQERAEENNQTYLKLISNQSFQDLTGQTLKKVINFIETLQYKLIELLPTYSKQKAGSEAEATKKPVKEDEGKSKMQSQDQVDQLLADLGF